MIKWLLRLAVFSSTITIAALIVVYYGFQASLPELEGDIQSPDIIGKIMVDRDEQGQATLTADNRTDLAFATGYIHAQERFFQMDLSRRLASGELSELFGS
jgi:penicillin amidase